MKDRIRVLYVDDKSALPEIKTLFLEHKGEFTLATRTSVVAALRMLQKESCDAIVSGCRMPGIDAIGFLKEVRAVKTTIPFIIVTEKISEEVMVEALNNGADFYLRKDDDKDAFFTQLSHVIRQSVLLRQTQKTLAEQEERYHDLRNANDLIQSVAPDGHFLFVNKKWLDTLGYQEHELAGLTIFDIIDEESLRHCMETFGRVMAGENVGFIDAVFKTRDGRKVFVEGMANCKIAGGKPQYTRGIFKDVTDRKKAEEALRESEDRYRTLIENADEAIFVIQDGRISYANPKLQKMGDYTLAELAQKPFLEFVHPDDRVMVWEQHLRRLKGEALKDLYTFRIVSREGFVLWVQINASLITWNGKPAVIVLLSDITGRKKAEAALRESEEIMALVMDGVPTLISYHDTGTRFLFANKAHEEWYGRSGKDLIGKRLKDLLPADVYARALPYYERVLSGKKVSFESHTRDRDGRERVLHVRLVPHVHDTKVAGFFAAIEDITPRKKAEESVRESEEKYRALVETTSDFIWEVDERGVYTYTSPKVRDLLGYEPGELIGKTPFDLMPPEEADRVRAEFRRCLAERVPIAGLENRNLKKDGSIVTLETSGVPRFDTSGRFLGYRGIDRDVSDRRGMESAFQALVRSMVGTTGLNSLQNITENVSAWLGADCVMIGEIQPDHQKVKVLSMHLDGKEVTDFSYTLKGTPCDNVAEKGFCLYADNVRALFPESKDLANLNIRGYAGTPLRNSAGEVMGVLCVLSRTPIKASPALQEIMDIIAVKAAAEIERARISAALKESEERFRMLLQHVPSVAVQGYAMDGTTQYWNEASEKIYGYTAEEAIGKNLVDLIIPPEMGDDVRGAIKYMAETGQPIPASELSLMRKDGSRVALYSSHALVRKSSGDLELFCIDIDLTGLKRAEEALRESEEHYRSLAEHVHDGIFISQGGRFVFVNSLTSQISGYSKDELLGMEFFDLAHPEDRAYVQGIADRRARGEPVPDMYELRILRKDGAVRYVELAVTPIMYKGSYAALGAGRDITERKQAEEALRENRQILSEAMDLARLANWEYDIKTGVFTFDDRFYSLFGTTAEREGGNRMPADVYTREFVPPEDRHIVAEELEKAGKATDANYMSQREHRIIRRDGEVRHIVVRIEVIQDAEGRITKARGVKQDITERKRMEEALRESEEHYRSLAEHVHDGIFIYKANRFVFVNTLICQLTGYSKDELLSMDFFDLVHPDDRAHVRETAQRRARGEPVPDLYELRVVRKDGSVRYAELALSIILMKGGYAVLGAGRDITERKQAEEALRQANRKLTMLNSITRHDILNQLTALLGYIEFSKEDIKDPALLEYVEKEDQAAKAIRTQIEFTRSYQDIGTQEPRWQILTLAIDAAHRQLKTDRVAVDASINGVEIFADPLLEKVFYNLMENSLRHGERVSRMRFSCRETGYGLVITYTDDGVGIPAKDKLNLFRRGFGKHTGLGLFLSKEILSITGITIAENGEPGKGVRFEMMLPNDVWRRVEEGRGNS